MTSQEIDTASQVVELTKLFKGKEVRIELGDAYGVKRGVMRCARFSTKVNGRWKEVSLPLLLAPEGGGWADILRILADVIEL